MGVPQLPGVPPLASYAPIPSLAATLLSADAPDVFFQAAVPQWGIFQDGFPIVLSDSVSTMSYKKESALADFPIEEGGFETYDKVALPAEARFRFTSGGDVGNRAALLSSIDAISGDTNLYQIVTPENVYPTSGSGGFNITHYDFNRAAQNGLGLLMVDVWCLEVRVSSDNSAFQNTQSPGAAGNQNGGTVAATTTPGGNAGNVGPPSPANANQPGFVGGQGAQATGGPPTFQ